MGWGGVYKMCDMPYTGIIEKFISLLSKKASFYEQKGLLFHLRG